MKLTLANGKELEAIKAVGGREFFQNASRDAITFYFPTTADIVELDADFSEQNCETITIGTGNVHSGYALRMNISKIVEEVERATETTAPVMEEYIVVKMAQRTYLETQLAQLVITQAEQDDALVELADMVAEL